MNKYKNRPDLGRFFCIFTPKFRNMRKIILPLLLMLGMQSYSQYSVLRIQDFDTIATPAWGYTLTSGNLQFVNGNSASNDSPSNSPVGINGSWAWKQEGQSGGVSLTFDNVNTQGYDSVFIRFRLAAFSLNGTNGLDAPDYVTTAVSLNNGVNWHDQIKITGHSGGSSRWPYTATGTAQRTYSTSAVTVFAPPVSGLTMDGFSTVFIRIPNTTGQVQVKITLRSSTAQERWCADNVELLVKNARTDAGLESFVNLADSVCSGPQNINVVLKNHGPQPLTDVKINWKVNNLQQPVYNWTGNLAVNQTANVNIGSFTFNQGTQYNLQAYTSNPNSLPDTLNSNDTIVKSGLFVKPAPTINLTATSKTICLGDSVSLSGTLTGMPSWSISVSDGQNTTNYPAIINPNFSFWYKPTVNTTYSIIALSDAGGCSTQVNAAMTVTVNQGPVASLTAYGNTTFCPGDSVTLGLNPVTGVSYKWMKDGTLIPGATNYIYAAKQSGAYSIVVTGANGCSTTSLPLTVTTWPEPLVFLGNDTNLAPNASITLNAGTGFSSYLWSTGQNNPSITIDTMGHGLGTVTVWVRVTDSKGCKGSDTIKITFVHNPGFMETKAEGMDLLQNRPNPAGDKTLIEFSLPNSGKVLFEVRNLLGNLVYKEESGYAAGSNHIELNLESLPAGIYTYSIRFNRSRLVRKMVVVR